MGPGMKLDKHRYHPVGPPGETETQREARVAITPPSDLGEMYWFWCPGCNSHHTYRTKLAKGEAGPTWGFNGNMEKPSFTPSLRVFYPAHMEHGVKVPEKTLCHLYLTDGVIRYEGDCIHNLAGKQVPLGEIP